MLAIVKVDIGCNHFSPVIIAWVVVVVVVVSGKVLLSTTVEYHREKRDRWFHAFLNWNSTPICRVSLNNHDSVLDFQQTDSSHRITEVLTHSFSMYRVHVGGDGSPRLLIFFIAMNVLGTYIVVVSRCLLYGDCLETPSLISWPLNLSSPAVWYIVFCSTKLLLSLYPTWGACFIADHRTKEGKK